MDKTINNKAPSPNGGSKGSSRFQLTLTSIISKFGTITLIIFAFILYALLIPPTLLLLSPLYLYRYVIILLAKIFKPEFISIVNTRDGVVGRDETDKRCECVLTLALTMKGTLDLDHVRAVFLEKVINEKDPLRGNLIYEKLKWYYETWMGYAFWREEKEFRIEDHIRLLDDDEGVNNNEEPLSEGDLMRRLGPLTTKPFKKGQALWEMLVVPRHLPGDPGVHGNKGQSEKKFIIIMRVHHALCDGYSLIKILITNLGGVDIKEVYKPPEEEGKNKPAGSLNLVGTYLGVLFLSPYFHLKQFVIDIDRNLWHLREGDLAKEWLTIRTDSVALRDVKMVGKDNGVSTTAVLLAAFAGGIRNFLKHMGVKETKLPEVMRALAPMPWTGHPMTGTVNHWTLGFLELPVGAKGPSERIRGAQKSVSLLKKSPILLTNFGTVPILLGPPSWVTDIWATNWMSTMILSNFPGPEFPLKVFDGMWELDDVMFWLPQMRGSSSVGVAFISYNGGVRVAVTLDKKIIPNQEQADLLCKYVNLEFKNLIEMTQDNRNCNGEDMV